MTILENSIHIDAPPEKVWSVLASLDLLERYTTPASRSPKSSPPRGRDRDRRADAT